jgi:predicted nucleic acid-binding protein
MDEGPIVCNAGPLIALSMIGSLHLLPALYRTVLVPEEVLQEVVESGAGRSGAREVASAAWLQRAASAGPPDLLLAKELGAGEAAVISTAYWNGARLVLLDERRARRIAEQAYRLRVKGSAGILVSARRAGLIPRVRPLLETLSERGYFLARRLIERACQEVGE